MNCDLCKSEMYAWRYDNDVASFQPLFDHLDQCPECARLFGELTASDGRLETTFQSFPESPFLENRIIAGLAHQRAQAAAHRSARKWWVLLPVLACLLIVLFLAVEPWWQQERLNQQVAILLRTPPALQIVATDRRELLNWSASFVAGASTLPPELDRVQFRGAATLRFADHKAVFLKMKNEGRASLVVVDTPLTKDKGFHKIEENSGSASLWSDGKRSYLLLFNGNAQEMRAYMQKMGISA